MLKIYLSNLAYFYSIPLFITIEQQYICLLRLKNRGKFLSKIRTFIVPLIFKHATQQTVQYLRFLKIALRILIKNAKINQFLLPCPKSHL